jgi:hypothetical protein
MGRGRLSIRVGIGKTARRRDESEVGNDEQRLIADNGQLNTVAMPQH